MATQDLVLVDTCLWVPFFNRPQGSEKKQIDQLLDDDRVALIAPILTEVLIGFKRDEHADWVASALRGVHFLTLTWTECRTAARLGRKLIAQGHSLPLSDLLLAAVTLERDAAIFTTDPHFDLVPTLKRYQAE